MYRLLIVDDEPIIVEGLTELFEQQQRFPLEVHRAFDGLEALELIRRLRMDVVLTDIEMPGMNGIELQLEGSRLWPRCKFVFLTGYDDFEYVQSSVRGGAVDYVLKTEGDEPILAAVGKAIGLLAQEMDAENLIDGARRQMQAALPVLRRTYLNGLLAGTEADSEEERRRKFAELGIPLDASRPVYVVLGRIDRAREEMSADLALFSVHNVTEELFSPDCRIVHLSTGLRRIVWFVQPGRSSGEENLHGHLIGTLEGVQAACRQYLKTVCSFVASRTPCAWRQLPDKFDRLTLLFERGLGLGSETLLSDERMFADGRRNARSKASGIRLLETYLANRESDIFFARFDELTAAVGQQDAMQAGSSLEAFYELAALFFAQLNRLELLQAASEELNIGKLMSIREHESWPAAAAYFRELAEWLFERMRDQNERETSDVVTMLQQYVADNLGGDLSLNRLADVVYLTPFYLSRLYKQKTGVPISDYITEVRLNEAFRLLEHSHLKIHEIGERVGYDSAAYFTKFFKKLTRMTPQEYRDAARTARKG